MFHAVRPTRSTSPRRSQCRDDARRSGTVGGPSRSGRAFVRQWLPAVGRLRARAPAGNGCSRWLGVKSFLLPPFSDVLRALWENRDALRTGAWITFKEALGGLVFGSAGAIVAALVLARWRPLGNALLPYLIAANAIPIIAFAPITNAWFGTLTPVVERP